MLGGAFIFMVCPSTLKSLIGLRNMETEWNPNTWFSFGGTMETDETPSITAVREFMEETGIHCDNYSMSSLPLITTQTEDKLGQIHTLSLYLGIMSTEIIPTINEETQKWKWCKLSDIPKLNMHPALISLFTDDSALDKLKSVLKHYSK